MCVACNRSLVLLDAGALPEGLQRPMSGDLDDASSATESCETASLCDFKPAGTGDAQNPAQGSHGIPSMDTDQVHVTPEQHIWRGFRTPGVHSHYLLLRFALQHAIHAPALPTATSAGSMQEDCCASRDTLNLV